MIEVTGLSSVTDTESLRVSGLGDARLLVVNCLREQFTEISESTTGDYLLLSKVR